MPRRHGIKTAARVIAREDASLRKRMTTDSNGRKNAMPVQDSFVNFAQNLGIGANGPLSTASYGFNPITRIRNILEWIHRGSWLGATAVDLKADDMTRAGVEIEGGMKPKDMEKIEKEIQRLDIWGSLCATVKWAKLYGGSVGYLMIEGQDPTTPLRVDTIGKGAFRGVLPLDRWMLEPSLTDLVTEQGPFLGKPKFYTINAMSPALPRIKFHYTRCIRLVGIQLPYWQSMQENLWGISVLERVYDRMVAFDSATTGAAQLVYKAFLRTYKVKGLRELVGAGGRAYQGLVSQVNLMRNFQNSEGITLIDDEDTLELAGTNAFSGLSDALQQLGQQFSGAVQIPQTRLFGQSPTGFNSGDNDLRMYYDSILQEQNKDLLPGVTTVYMCTAYSLGVQLKDDFAVAFRPLWQMSEKEKAEVAEITGRTVGSAMDQGIISPHTAAMELKQASKETGVFTNITDKEINELEEVAAPRAEEALGGAEPGDGPGADKADNETDARAKKGKKKAVTDGQTEERIGGRVWVVINNLELPGKNKWTAYERANPSRVMDPEPTRAALMEILRQVSSRDSIDSVLALKRVHNVDVVVEQYKGELRAGMGGDGQPFENELAADYGYIRRVDGEDGDKLDCFIGTDYKNTMAWTINTVKPYTKEPDERKMMLCYPDAQSAIRDFIASYDKGMGWEIFGGILPCPMSNIREWQSNQAPTL